VNNGELKPYGAVGVMSVGTKEVLRKKITRWQAFDVAEWQVRTNMA
jgi:hypothetical protein